MTLAAGCLVVSGLAATAGPATAATTATAGKLFAAASDHGTATCRSAADACTLAKALGEATAGDTVELVTAGQVGTASSYYSPGLSGFSVATSGTSAASPVTIEPAPGVKSPILSGGGTRPILKVGDGMHLVIDSLTIRDGFSGVTTSAGGISNNSRAVLNVKDSIFTDNTGPQDGGAIENGSGGTLTVAHSTFSTNGACLGGAIANGYDGSGTATVTGSTFLDNSAICQGGAIANANHGSGRLSVTDSTFSANSAPDGGAIENGDGGTGTATITGSTFSGNSASDDGTVIDNGDAGGKGSTVVVGADVIAGFCNQLSGTWTDRGDNVAFSDSCFKGGQGDVADTKVGSALGPLADNGGSTETMILLPGNPASGLMANPTSSGLCPVAADQTGRPSPPGAPCNAGALQAHPAIHSVTFSGPADAQVVTLTGTGFGTRANLGPPATPCSSPETGEDYGALFYFTNETEKWSAGNDASPNCDYVGLVITSYSNTTIVFGFSSNFSTYSKFRKKDEYAMHLLGASFSGKW
jgi:hypothetical protein